MPQQERDNSPASEVGPAADFAAAHDRTEPRAPAAEALAGADDAGPAGVHDVFMLGWEFPPFISGGLGTACYGLTKAMSRRGDQVVFVMPGATRVGFAASYAAQSGGVRPEEGVRMPEFDNVEFHGIDVHLDPYARPARTAAATPPVHRGFGQRPPDVPEAHDVVVESHKFSERAVELALRQRALGKYFDVVHAHDWMTFEAARAVAGALGVPWVAHVHSTEYDRNPGDPDADVVAAERDGLGAADAVIAVSQFTARLLAARYGLPAERVAVVHNAVELDNRLAPERPVEIGAAERIVLFVGRFTAQKGPDLFVKAAARVLEAEPAVRFVMTGTGEQFDAVRQLARGLGIDRHFLFTGFLRPEDVDRMYRAADVFVMPSVSEPFGMVSLEAAARDVPVILSKQSGAAEVLDHALKVDFWDTEELASKIVSVLRDQTLAAQLAERGSFQVRQMRWADAAEAVARVYDRIVR